MESDKELLRKSRYEEALGVNYNEKPIYVMVFSRSEFIDQLDERFSTKTEAYEWLENNYILNTNEHYRFGNINADWL